MTEQSEQTPSTPKRLNPFAFPSETDQRFVLFTSAAVLWVLNWAGLIGETVTVDVLGGQMTPGLSLLWKVALPVALFLVAVMLYLTHPARMVRHQKLAPFDPAQDASFQRAVEQLTTVAGLSAPPRIMLRPGKQLDGQAFGLPNGYSVRLDEVMRLALRKAPQEFRAVMLHELAHISNGDIGRTYFAQALWSATLWMAIIPFLVVLVVFPLVGSRIDLATQRNLTIGDLSRLLTVSLPTFVLLPIQFGIGVFMAYSIRSSLLRARETEADWRAATWGAEEGLIGMLRRKVARTSIQTGFRARLAGLMGLHPTAQRRLDALLSPGQLFQVKPEIALFVGWLTMTSLLGASELFPAVFGVLVGRMESMIAMLEQARNSTAPIVWSLLVLLAAMALALLVFLILAIFFVLGWMTVSSVGLEVLREAVADVYFARNRFHGFMRLLPAALLIVLGLYLGMTTSPLGLGVLGAPAMWSPLGLAVLSTFPVACVFVWLSLAGLRLFAGRLLGAHAGNAAPVARRRLLLAGFSGYYALFLLWFVLTQAASLSQMRSLSTEAQVFGAWSSDSLSLAVSVSVAGLLFGWLVTVVWRWLRPPRCSRCHVVARQRQVLGARCSACGAELTPWLFVD